MPETLDAPHDRLAAIERVGREISALWSWFAAFMDAGAFLACAKDERGAYVYVNQPLADRFARPVPEWIGRTDTELFGREVIGTARVRENDALVLRTGETLRTSVDFPAPGGLARKMGLELARFQVVKFRFTEQGRRFIGAVALEIAPEGQEKAP